DRLIMSGVLRLYKTRKGKAVAHRLWRCFDPPGASPSLANGRRKPSNQSDKPMTIERPMFPPRAESPNVIEFPTGSTVLPDESKFAAMLQRSRLEVVQRKTRRRKRRASAQDYIEANAVFAPWERLPEIMKTIGEEWAEHGVEVRMAYGAITSPQSVLEGIHED